MLQLVYLGAKSEIVRYEPDEADLRATERQVDAIWEAIELAKETGEFLPRRGKPCDWCSFKAHCPALGGTVLPMPPRRHPGLGCAAGRDAAGGKPGADYEPPVVEPRAPASVSKPTQEKAGT